MLIVNDEVSRPAGRDQGFPIVLDLQAHPKLLNPLSVSPFRREK